MKLCIIGTGYVGLVTGCCFADMGNDVICVDNNEKKIERLKKGKIDIFEPGLPDLTKRNLSERRLSFTTDLSGGVRGSDIIFIAVGTPPDNDGTPNLDQVEEVAGLIGAAMNGYKIVTTKSTVPVGTTEHLAEIIRGKTDHAFDVVSNPEFLKEGTAVEDFMRPERVVVGTNSQRAVDVMKELYAPYIRTGNPIFVMDIRSAELSKYASNTFVAAKISFMNEMANLCDHLGADVDSVRRAMGADSRIGPKFLFSGVGFGGLCLPKDLLAVIKMAKDVGYPVDMITAVRSVNDRQRDVFTDKIALHFGDKLGGLTLAVWGLSFKPNTDDIRDAPSIFIVERLLDLGASVVVFDPVAMNNFKTGFKGRVRYASNAYDALKGADALCLITEWNEFRNPDFKRMKGLMKRPIIFDGRNQYHREELERIGFTYYCIGRPGREGKNVT